MSRTLSSPAREAATAVLALINSRPQSPRIDEIEAIIAKVALPASESSPLAQKIRALIPAVQEAVIAEQDAEHRAIEERREAEACPTWRAARKRTLELDAELTALSQQLWRTPVGDFDNILLRAEIAQHHACDWPASSDGLEDPGAYSLRAYGEVTMAVLAMGGRRFSRHGTMLAFLQGTEARNG